MKYLMTASILIFTSAIFGQTVDVQQPIEERIRTNQWWWLLGVVITLAIGIAIYMAIKKNPRKDAVR